MVDRPPLVIDGSHAGLLDWRRVGRSDPIHEVHREAAQQAQEACAGWRTRTDTFGCGVVRKSVWVNLTLCGHCWATFFLALWRDQTVGFAVPGLVTLVEVFCVTTTEWTPGNLFLF